MQRSSSLSLSVDPYLESFDELTSVSVARGFSSNAVVENEFGSLLDALDLDESLLSRLSVSLGKYYTLAESSDNDGFDNVLDLMHHLKLRHFKPTMKYSIQQVYEAALAIRDHHAIMIALSGCVEYNDNISSLWTDVVLGSVGKALEKIKSLGNKSRQEYIGEWNYMMQYDRGVLDKDMVVKWFLEVFQKCTSDQILVLVMTLKGIIGDFVISNDLSSRLIDSFLEKIKGLNADIARIGGDRVKFLNDALYKLSEMVFRCNPDILLIPKYQQMCQSEGCFASIIMSRDIEMRALQLNFRKKIFHKVNRSIFSKLRFIDDDISFSFALDQSKSFQEQIHKICSKGIVEDSYFTAVVAIQKAIITHGEELAAHIQDYLVSFLFNVDFKPEELDKLIMFYGELVRVEIFNYIQFLQKLISLGFLVSGSSKHTLIMDLIKRLPTKVFSRSELNIKNMFLDDDLEINEVVHSFQIRIVAALPKVFLDVNRVDTRREIPRNDQSADFEWNRIDHELLYSIAKIGAPRARAALENWIEESIYNFVVQKQQIGMDNWKNVAVAGASLLNNRQFSSLMRILASLRCHRTIFRICLWMIDRTNDYGILNSIINLIRQTTVQYSSYPDISCVFDVLLKKYRDLRSKTAMIELSIGYYLLEIEGRAELGYSDAYRSEFNQVNNYLKEIPPKTQIRSKLRELGGLIDGTISVESSLSALLRKYRNQDDKIKHIFRNVFENLREYSKTAKDFWSFRVLISRNTEVLRFLSLGNNSITESYISLLKDQFHLSSHSSLHILTEDWFIIFSIQLIAARCIKLNQFLSSFAVPLLKTALEKKPTENESAFNAHFLGFLRICLFTESTKLMSENIFLTVSELIALDSIRSNDLGDETSFFICYELFYQVYLLSKKAHEFAENFHIEIEKLAAKIFSDRSWFCSVACRKCLWLYKSHSIPKLSITKSNTNPIHFSILILKLEQKSNNASYFCDWLKNPLDLYHIKMLLLVDLWTLNGSLTFDDVATQILDLIFESLCFDEVLSFVWLVQSEIALILLQKLIALYPVSNMARERNSKFMELLACCFTHFTDCIKSENYYGPAVSSVLIFSNKVFQQLTVALEENSNVPKCIEILEVNIPLIIIFKSLSCFSVTDVFTTSRMTMLLRILVSYTCIHGPFHIFSQLLDLVSVILTEFRDPDLSEIFQGITMNLSADSFCIDGYKRLLRIFPADIILRKTNQSKWDFFLKHNEWERILNIVPLPNGSENEKTSSAGSNDLSQKIAMFEKKRKRVLAVNDTPVSKKIKVSE